MPATSKAQRRLMGAAEHGADFPMAKKLRKSMSKDQLHDFAATKEKGLPVHVKGHGRKKPEHKEPKPKLKYGN